MVIFAIKFDIIYRLSRTVCGGGGDTPSRLGKGVYTDFGNCKIKFETIWQGRTSYLFSVPYFILSLLL
jgi:hypothetical protein